MILAFSRILGLVPGWVYALALAALLALYGVQAVQLSGSRSKLADAQVEVEKGKTAMASFALGVSETTRLLKAANDADAQRRLDQSNKALQNALVRQTALASSASAARSDADRLRDAIARLDARPGRDPVPSPAVEAYRAEAVTARGLLAACVAEYQGMAEDADRHASDALTLDEAWPN